MTDPTEMVITGGFAAAFGLFVISATMRSLRKGRQPAPSPEPLLVPDGDPPDQAPVVAMLPPELPVGRVPVWFYRNVDLAGAMFVFLVFSGLVIASFGGPQHAPEALDPAVLLTNIGFQFVMAGAVALAVAWRVDWVAWLGLRWSSWKRVFLIAPCSVFVMWTVFGGLQYSGYLKWMESLGVETVQDTVQLLQKSEDPLILGLMAFAAIVAAPLCEEIIFRGYFYPVLKRFAGVGSATACSALVFACAHGNLTAVLPLFIFGCLLVFIYEKTGSLWAPISVHFCFNSATVLMQMAARYFRIPLDSMP
jgi:membrane protease YdiL (CAAX protease family)